MKIAIAIGVALLLLRKTVNEVGNYMNELNPYNDNLEDWHD